MIGNAVQDAINSQIQKELYSSYLYLAMAAYFEERSLAGLAKWMRLQADEEREHAMKFYDHLIDRGGRVSLMAIEAPKSEWPSSMGVFKEAQAHEAKVTASIHSLYDLAVKEKDYPAQVLLQWFITEQVEEERNVAGIVAQLELVEARASAILMLDHRLGKRGGG